MEGVVNVNKENIFQELLRHIEGHQCDHKTPLRAHLAWESLCAGYGQNPDDFFETMPAEGNQTIEISDLTFCSICEHHLLPFWGIASISYKPQKLILGLSKAGRVLEVFARRIQIQERINQQVAEYLFEKLSPKWVEVVTEAFHLCMSSRGVMQVSAKTKVIQRIARIAK